MDKHSQMSRRRILQYTAGSSVVGLAGCLSNGNGSAGSDGMSTDNNQGGNDNASNDDGKSIFMLLPDQVVPRYYEQDAPRFEEYMAELEPNWDVTVQDAGGDQTVQLAQVEDAITQGADGIVLMAAVPNEAGGALSVAEDAGIPVILHEHGAEGGSATARAAFDARASGVAQGEVALELIENMLERKDTVNMARVYGLQGGLWGTQIKLGQEDVLQPLIDDGRVDVVADTWTDWSADQARTFAEDTLTRFGDDLDMFLVPHDPAADGVVQAMISQGYEKGDIALSGGQNGELIGAQLILDGWLNDTYYKPIPKLSEASARLIVAAVNGNEMPQDLINGEYENETTSMPAANLEGITVTEENVDVFVEDGLFTWEQMCENVEGSSTCDANT